MEERNFEVAPDFLEIIMTLTQNSLVANPTCAKKFSN